MQKPTAFALCVGGAPAPSPGAVYVALSPPFIQRLNYPRVPDSKY